MTRPLISFLIFLAVTRPALGQATQGPAPEPTEPAYPIVRVGMVSYLQYDAEVENREGVNAFDVTRGYINVNAQLSPNVRFRFTPDVRRATDGATAGSLVLRVKYAFAQLDKVGPERSWLRFGAHQTPWLDFEEGINRYRVQGQMSTERDGLIPGSSDFGVGYFTPLGKYAEVQAGVYNGEGYTQTDSNKYKSVQGRLTVRPFAGRGLANGLRVSGFFNAGWYAADRPRRLAILMGSFEHPNVVATLQHAAATESPTATGPRDIERGGSSGYVEIRQGPSGWAGLARVDRFDPDRENASDSRRRVIVGAAYWVVWPRSRVGIVVTNEQVDYDANALRTDENRLLAQMHVEF